jgi:F0F1-type ATP synthase gamma subunit
MEKTAMKECSTSIFKRLKNKARRLRRQGIKVDLVVLGGKTCTR